MSVDPVRVLTELPTQPGSVIARTWLDGGLVQFETALLTHPQDIFATMAGHADTYEWALSGRDRTVSTAEMALLLTLDEWTLIGVVPLPDGAQTAAQRQRLGAYQRSSPIYMGDDGTEELPN